ncbi:hypothetical protein CAPTEDRAFT_216716 [Capitella teleta]|uniref:Ion transport N-terminal domain-containing protein n=1 Tax=Capitella teleta TaxID=283909 RepID=R7TAZ8_CAPTE|nr:hypothetical protein CAPTEDRAFT_216716 [Capitella teleta]|eukprot:ELT88667.1 hypothetical protein CAPTEDRAFT_216716 [Capitella teleta]
MSEQSFMSPPESRSSSPPSRPKPPASRSASGATRHANSIPRFQVPSAGGPCGRVASLSRPPLERASSVPERGSSRPTSDQRSGSNSSMNKTGSVDKGLREALARCHERSLAGSADSLPPGASSASPPHPVSGSGNSICIHRSSLERITHASSDRLNACPGNGKELLRIGQNNVPVIDAAVTPPVSPSKGGVAAMFHSASLKGFARRKLPTLKFKAGRMGSLRSHRERASSTSSPSCSTQQFGNPTITVNDADHESLVSDYLTSDVNFKKAPTVDGKVNNFPNSILGDEASLYGTPKEELSPLKDCETPTKTVNTSATNYLKDQIVSFFQPSDNKLAMKLFGNKNALRKEKMRQKAAGNWVIHPCSNFSLSRCMAEVWSRHLALFLASFNGDVAYESYRQDLLALYALDNAHNSCARISQWESNGEASYNCALEPRGNGVSGKERSDESVP